MRTAMSPAGNASRTGVTSSSTPAAAGGNLPENVPVAESSGGYAAAASSVVPSAPQTPCASTVAPTLDAGARGVTDFTTRADSCDDDPEASEFTSKALTAQ